MKKRFNQIFILAFLLILVTQLSMVSAAFTIDHEYWSLKGLDETDSPIANLCRDRPDLILDGNTAADIMVLHYVDNKVTSYISTHTKGSGYLTCLEKAGTDKEMKCFCYGVGLHNTQDNFFHNEEGLVPKYLKLFFSANLIGHMTLEYDYQLKHQKMLVNDPIVTSGRLEFHDTRVLDNLFEQTGGDVKYLELLADMTGLSLDDLKNDANIFANGYKGVGFYDTVYSQKIKLPFIFWGVSIGLIIIGFGMILVLLIVPRVLGIKTTKWKLILIMIYLIFAILGILLIISMYTNNTWSWVQAATRVVPLRISQNDILDYNNKELEATKEFLKTGNLAYEDNSGLSYRDSNGIWHEGALAAAETPFKLILWLGILPIFIILNLFLLYKTFRNSKKPSGLNTFMNILGWILLVIFIMVGVLFTVLHLMG